MADPRYPIGEFSFDGTLTEAQKARHLDDVEQTPARLRAAVRGLSDPQSTHRTARVDGRCGRLSTTCPRAT